MCINELDIGGAEKAFVRIATGLKALGWHVRVISLRDAGPLHEPLQRAGIPVEALHGGGFGDMRTYFRLRRALRAASPDILLCFLHQANIYGRLAGCFSGGPVVISGIRVADRRRWVVLTDRWTRSLTAHYVAVSQRVADVHAALCGIDRQKITAIRNGVDLSADLPAKVSEQIAASDAEVVSDNAKSEHRQRILFVGRLTAQKDPLNLLNAFAGLPEVVRETAVLQLVGSGPLYDALRAEIDQRQLSDEVQLLGQRTDVPQLMQAATVLVLPSLWEGLPNVVLEAMAAGLPVIATDVDGVQELIDNEGNGWLIPAQDPAALSRVLQIALSSPDLRRKFAERSQAIVRERFTWNSVVAEYDRLLLRFLPHQLREERI